MKIQPYLYDEVPIQSIYSNWFTFEINGKYDIYDSHSGKIILEAIYDELESQEYYDCVITKKDGKMGFFNYEFCVPPVYDNIVGNYIGFDPDKFVIVYYKKLAILKYGINALYLRKMEIFINKKT